MGLNNPSTGGSLSKPTSQIVVSIGLGFGSTNTTVRHFTTTNSTSGTDITYASSTTNGDSFTINTAGVYACYYSENIGISDYIGITKNGSALTTSIHTTTLAQGKVAINTGFAGDSVCTAVTLNCASGDIIRPGASGSGADYNDASSDTIFIITRVA